MMIAVTGRFRVPAEARAEALPIMETVVRETRAEAGCLAYSYAEDLLEPGLFRIAELWESREALSAHFVTAHMRHWIARRAELGVYDRAVTALRIEGEEAL